MKSFFLLSKFKKYSEVGWYDKWIKEDLIKKYKVWALLVHALSNGKYKQKDRKN